MNEERIVELLYALSEAPTESVPSGLAQSIKSQIPSALEVSTETQVIRKWHSFVPNRANRIAAAVLLVLGLSGLFMVFSPGTSGNHQAIASIMEPILSDHSVIFNIFYQGVKSNWTAQVKNREGQNALETIPGERTIVFDYTTSSALILSENSKKAAYVDFINLFGTRRSFLDRIREVMDRIKSDPNIIVKSLGQKVVDGRQAVGFKAIDNQKEITVWADANTMLPIRIEQDVEDTKWIYKDFQFDVEMEEPLLFMETPDGYTLQDNQSQVNDYTEKDFLNGLRLWTGVVRDGFFPDSLSLMDWYKQYPQAEEKLMVSGLDKSLWEKMKTQIARSMLFVNVVKVDGEIQYAGRGVRLGDADRPVFWYRSSQNPSGPYRVIYGDLHVAEVDAETVSAW